MERRLITADKVFPVYRPMVERAIIVMDGDGRIEDFVHPVESPDLYRSLEAHTDLERYSGWLIPGMINSHCHLELSYTKGLIPRNTGLPEFLRAVTRLRNHDRDEIEMAMVLAEQEMMEEGIVAVGDISNTDHSLSLKSRSRMHYHTFIEVFDLHRDRASKCFEDGSMLVKSFQDAGLKASLVPHATYTVSSQLLFMLLDRAAKECDSLSIHNQETPSEDDFFRTGTGPLAEFLSGTGLYKDWQPTGHSSLRSVLSDFRDDINWMLVHDTFTTLQDVEWVKEKFHRIWWCLCPKANDYIEKSRPDASLLLKNDQRILIGTDSFASNDRLSLLEEISFLLNADKSLSFDQLLKSVTHDAAVFFGWANELGDLSKGKRPGLVLVDQSSDSKVRLNSRGLLVSAR